MFGILSAVQLFISFLPFQEEMRQNRQLEILSFLRRFAAAAGELGLKSTDKAETRSRFNVHASSLAAFYCVTRRAPSPGSTRVRAHTNHTSPAKAYSRDNRRTHQATSNDRQQHAPLLGSHAFSLTVTHNEIKPSLCFSISVSI